MNAKPGLAPIAVLLLLSHWLMTPSTLGEAKHQRVEARVEIERFKGDDWSVLYVGPQVAVKFPCRKFPNLCTSGQIEATLARLSMFRDDWVYWAQGGEVNLVTKEQAEKQYSSQRTMELIVILVLLAAAVLYWRVSAQPPSRRR